VRIAAVVLAAGEGRRLGGPKALLSFGGTSFLAHACGQFSAAGVHETVAVLGAQAARVRAEAGVPEGVTVVVNEAWPSGMLSSICCGLAALEGADAVLVHPVDSPSLSGATIRAVVAALEAGARIAVPTHAGRRGHPAGFSRSVWPALREAAPELGARAVLRDHPAWVVHVPAGPDCLCDIDTPEDLAALVRS
jgi:CTP:molybdopterin cytidylyltransferase MocA